MSTQTVTNTIIKSYITNDKTIDVLNLIQQVAQRKEFIDLLKKEKKEANETKETVKRLRAMMGQYNGKQFWGILPDVCEDRIIYFLHQSLRSKIVKVLNGLFWGRYDWWEGNSEMEKRQTGTCVWDERRRTEDLLDKVRIRCYDDGHKRKIRYTSVWGTGYGDRREMKFSRFLELKYDKATPEQVEEYQPDEQRLYEKYKCYNTYAGLAVCNTRNLGPNWCWGDVNDYWVGGYSNHDHLCYTGRNDIELAMVCNEYHIKKRWLFDGVHPADIAPGSTMRDAIQPRPYMAGDSWLPGGRNYLKYYPYLPDHPVPNKAWKVPQLKEYLKENGLKVGGKKDDLFQRAYTHWKSQ